jgi:hypothetical protein
MFEGLENYQRAKEAFKALEPVYKSMLIYDLLKSKDIDYTALSAQYVRYLEHQDKDNKNKLTEAGICISQHLFELKYTDKGRKKRNFDYNKLDESNKKAIQRSLYFLNQEHRLRMDSLNDEFCYNEEEARKLSWYERTKL